MIELNAKRFYEASIKLKELEEFSSQELKSENGSTEIELVRLKTLESNLYQFGQAADNLNAKLTSMEVERVRVAFKHRILELGDPSKYVGRPQPVVTPSILIVALTEIRKRFMDEIGAAKVLVLDTEKAKFFAPHEPLFGSECEAKFPSSVYEVDEAAKCYALNRPTAAVFHLMRTMEIAVRSIAKCLSIPDPTRPMQRNWGDMLQRIKEAIDAKWPQGSRLNGDGALFEKMYASLDAVKNPWRNATMHVEAKYTDDEARHIFDAVRVLMEIVASRLDESGEPMA